MIKKIQLSMLSILLLLIFGLSIGYAKFNTTIAVKGTNVIINKFDIINSDIRYTDNNTVDTKDITISSDSNVISVDGILNNNDTLEFEIKLFNKGNVDAKIDNIELVGTLNESKEILDENGNKMVLNDLVILSSEENIISDYIYEINYSNKNIKSNSSSRVIVTVKRNKIIEESLVNKEDLESSENLEILPEKINIQLKLNYIQK